MCNEIFLKGLAEEAGPELVSESHVRISKMDISKKIRDGLVIFDGAFGTMLQARGLAAGELPETWNVTHPDVVTGIHREYLDAGCEVITTNTFGANSLKYNGKNGAYTLFEVVNSAVSCARAAAENRNNIFIALDIGPLGKLVGKPYGIGFEEAVGVFSDTVKIGAAAGVDFILIETMNDIYELKAAVLAARESCSLPVIATVVVDSSGRMMSGSDAASVVALLEGLGVTALGMNCSLGPAQMNETLHEMLKYASVPVLVQPNAGMPLIRNGKTEYDITPEQFAGYMKEMAQAGAHGLGGCCGTTPEYIRELKKAVDGIAPVPVTDKGLTMISSSTHTLVVGKKPLLIGERINPTGKKKIKEALTAGNYSEIISEGAAQADAGADILDVNAGLPGIDEAKALKTIVTELQKVTDLPLQIDTADPAAMEAALRVYCGVPLINSVSGKAESMDAILPLAKKYGGVLIGLTLDENGIPSDTAGRLKIANKIYAEADKYGINPKNIIIDPLAMSVSADSNAALTTLSTVAMLNRMGRYTLLGVSNVSYGLPGRDIINSVFFTMALHAGLSLAIINPNSIEMQKAYKSFLALSGKDDNFAGYIAFASAQSQQASASAAQNNAAGTGANTVKAETMGTAGTSCSCCPPVHAEKTAVSSDAGEELYRAIVRGLGAVAAKAAERLLETNGGMDVIEKYIIPALKEVGEGFEKQRIYLPQLLMSAEAANMAFAKVKASMKSAGGAKGKIILATVKGDIHDIGKNIVKVLLENYGYEVIDLGRDVSYETILNSTSENKVRLVGLSALMTTTLPAMEKTVRLLHERFPECRVMVGGAVLTEEYAKNIGADYYAQDAMGAVKIAEAVFR